MLAITIKQPYAWAIAAGYKPVENRTWRPNQGLIGQRIAIHAGKEWHPDGGGVFAGMMSAIGQVEYCVTDDRSAVIAVVTFADVVTEHESPFFVGPFGYVFEDVLQLRRPVPCKGALGFWRLPDDVEREVALQIGEVKP